MSTSWVGPPAPPPGFSPPPGRPRPSAWWFAVGAAMLVAAVAVFAVVLWRAVSDFTAVDAAVPADGEPHAVTWSGSEQRMLWVRERDDADCTVVDPATGRVLDQRQVFASYSRSSGGPTWVGVTTFDGGSGRVEVTCAAACGPVEIGPAPEVAGFVGGILGSIAALLVLGLGGVAVLVVTGVLWATRGPGPRPGPAAPRPPVGPAR